MKKRAKFRGILALWYWVGFGAVTAAWASVGSDHFRILVLLTVAPVSLIPFLAGLAGAMPVERPVAVLAAAVGGTIALGLIVLPYCIRAIWPDPAKLSAEELFGNLVVVLFVIAGPWFAGRFLSARLARAGALSRTVTRDPGAGRPGA